MNKSLARLIAEAPCIADRGSKCVYASGRKHPECVLAAIAANPEATLAFLVDQGKVEQDKRPGLFGCPNVSDQSALCTCHPVYVLTTKGED